MRYRFRRRILGGAIAAIVLGVACAAPPEARSPAKAPAQEEAPPGRETESGAAKKPSDKGDSRAAEPPRDRPATPVMPATPQAGATTSQPSPAPQPSMEPADSARRREAALRAARTEVEQAQRDLETSMSDCAQACRALGSMERATGHLCDLASEHDDRRRCEDAKTAVLRARDKIRASCGSCPGGPSLDKTAPIPSRP